MKNRRNNSMKTKELAARAVSATILLALMLQAIPVSAAPANYANAIMADAPVGYWRLGESPGSSNAADASGNGGNGVYSGGITLGQPGLQGGDTGALFDGVAGSGAGASTSSPRVVVLNSNALNPRHITMEAKVRWGGPNSNQGQQRVLEKSSYAELAQYGLMVNNDGRVQVEIRTNAAQVSPGTVDGDPICPGWNTPGSTASVVCARSTGVVALNSETHIAATYDGRIIRIYLNGVFDSQADAGGDAGDISPKPPTPSNLRESGLGIGNQVERDRPFKGLIDEVVLFDKVLSADRISAHYKSQFLDEKSVFQYAVKFVCGRPDAPVVAPGTYFTAINVHNPGEKTAKFRKKIAVALPGEKAGPVSRFFDAKLGPDEAFEIDCPDILRHANARGFLKGFIVIETPVELDIVAVYTAAGASRQVETMDVEHVKPRRSTPATPEGQPDLIPVPHPQLGFCVRRDNNLIVTVKNQGAGAAGPSTTKVDFGAFGTFTQPTPALAPGAPVSLAFTIPSGCFDPDCDFRITVDSNSVVSESNEGNNTASGTCIG